MALGITRHGREFYLYTDFSDKTSQWGSLIEVDGENAGLLAVHATEGDAEEFISFVGSQLLRLEEEAIHAYYDRLSSEGRFFTIDKDHPWTSQEEAGIMVEFIREITATGPSATDEEKLQ